MIEEAYNLLLSQAHFVIAHRGSWIKYLIWIPVAIETAIFFWRGPAFNFAEARLSLLVQVLKYIFRPMRVACNIWIIALVTGTGTSMVRYAPSLMSWLALIVIGDFLYYAFHWLFHNARIFWARHLIHHSFPGRNADQPFLRTQVPRSSPPPAFISIRRSRGNAAGRRARSARAPSVP